MQQMLNVVATELGTHVLPNPIKKTGTSFETAGPSRLLIGCGGKI